MLATLIVMLVIFQMYKIGHQHLKSVSNISNLSQTQLVSNINVTSLNTGTTSKFSPYRPTSQGPIPVKWGLPRKTKLPPIPAHSSESIYENPYSTDINSENSYNDQSRSQKWSIYFLIIWLLMSLLIGATVMGLILHFQTSESK